MELGKKIKQLRFKAGLTQEQLADKLGIGPQSVSKWENAVSMPDITALPLLAEVFGVSIDDLFDLTVEQRLNRVENRLDIEKELPQDVFREYEDFLTIQLKNDPGLAMRSLVSQKDHIMYPVLCRVQPGCGNLTPHSHNGEELIYMISGVIEFRLNDEPPYILRAGDTFYYKGSDIHSWQNISSRTATLLWIHSSVSK